MLKYSNLTMTPYLNTFHAHLGHELCEYTGIALCTFIKGVMTSARFGRRRDGL
jgi:hypothetical protein